MVTAELLSRARAGDGEAFRELAESHRRELQQRRLLARWPAGPPWLFPARA